ncbi:MAG: family 10 glycosylhydrolase [Muribaculaceae bacterium]|nr:family 10 glycosylhydrolase [Muribaculaceae bacterium]
MKNLYSILFAAAVALPSFAGTPAEDFSVDLRREHRAVWMSPFLDQTWPVGAITEANINLKRTALKTTLTRLKNQGINCVYYHARNNCSTTYASEFEPYSYTVASQRGGTPGTDPFKMVVEEAHNLGLEIYAWVNPYRYSYGELYGVTDLDYETSHPEWLIKQAEQIILNPAIPEVQDRIEAIINEIATNYDIDGLIFDDYFYTSDTPESMDAEQYNAYLASLEEGEEKLDQAAWRRANVNETVLRARNAVKAARPYAVFAISPAGRISPPDIADYGFEDAPYGDMQYDSLHADPIKWVAEGWLDFLSPQVYWHSYFEGLTEWYSRVIPGLGRNLYTSVDCSRLSNNAQLYLDQIDFMRNHLRPNENGVVFFDYGAYYKYRETFDGSVKSFGEILAMTSFTTPALQPLQAWSGSYKSASVSNLRRSGNTLEWTEPAAAENRRYAIYAVSSDEQNSFTASMNKLVAVSYTNSYTIPAGEENAVYAVAVYNRYGYEYAPVMENGNTTAPETPELVYPGNGDEAADLFDFKWKGNGCRYVLQIASDPSFEKIAAIVETDKNGINSTDVCDFAADQQYFWRVISLGTDGSERISASSSFTAGRLAITSPASGEQIQTVAPTFTWTAAGNGTEYTLEISTSSSFNSIAYSATVDSESHTVASRALSTGKTYYARVTGSRGISKSVSATVTFSIAERTDYSAPAFINPSADGVTIHSNESVELEAWEGLTNVSLQISTSTTFPARSGTYTVTFNSFENVSKPLGEIKINAKALVDGTTYYTRTRGTYTLSTGSTATTDYSPVRSFVYSASAGVGSPTEESVQAHMEGSVLILGAPARLVEIYDAAGRLIASYNATGLNSLNLAHLNAGVYIIRTSGENISLLKWVK